MQWATTRGENETSTSRRDIKLWPGDIEDLMKSDYKAGSKLNAHKHEIFVIDESWKWCRLKKEKSERVVRNKILEKEKNRSP